MSHTAGDDYVPGGGVAVLFTPRMIAPEGTA
jgi:hypothetical protein